MRAWAAHMPCRCMFERDPRAKNVDALGAPNALTSEPKSRLLAGRRWLSTAHEAARFIAVRPAWRCLWIIAHPHACIHAYMCVSLPASAWMDGSFAARAGWHRARRACMRTEHGITADARARVFARPASTAQDGTGTSDALLHRARRLGPVEKGEELPECV